MKWYNQIKEKTMLAHPVYGIVKQAIKMEQRFKKGEGISEAEVSAIIEKFKTQRSMIALGVETTRIGRMNRQVLTKQCTNIDAMVEKLQGDLADRTKFTLENGIYKAVMPMEK